MFKALPQEEPKEKPKNASLLVFLGGGLAAVTVVIFGFILMGGYYIFSTSQPQNDGALAVTLILLGLTFGYNASMFFKDGGLEFSAFTGFFLVLLIVGVINSVSSANVYFILLLSCTSSIPVLFIYGDLTKKQVWDRLMRWVTDYAPKTWIFMIITGRYLSVPLGDYGFWGYVGGMCLGIIITYISRIALSEDTTKRKMRWDI